MRAGWGGEELLATRDSHILNTQYKWLVARSKQDAARATHLQLRFQGAGRQRTAGRIVSKCITQHAAHGDGKHSTWRAGCRTR